MLLYTVLGITVVALLALVVAVTSGSVLLGWFTVGASIVGLVLLALNELTQRGQRDAHDEGARERDAHDEGPREQAPVDEPRYSEPPPSVAPEPAQREEKLQPDIWPPGHRVHDDGGDADRAEPRRASGGEELRPDIWP